MFENHSDGVVNKTHVYANVTRKIMSEVSGIKLSDKTLKHAVDFDTRMRKKPETKKLF